MVDKASAVNNYTPMSNDNTAPSPLWKVTFRFQRILNGDLPEKLADALEDVAAAVSIHNKEATDGDDWDIALTTVGKPDVDAILERINGVAAAEGFAELVYKKDVIALRLPPTDWLRHVHDNFPPVVTGNFFVYGSHYKETPPKGLIPLKIDAATAFGSGEHETTRGCLLALEYLSKEKFRNGLDMGCGSGILAIALTKLWPKIRVTAVDIDPESVAVTNRHAKMNGAEKHITSDAGDGYRAHYAQENAPYDIITANILAGPLIYMSADLNACLTKGGYAILSGLLTRQKKDVVEAHEKQGLKLVHAMELGDWQALILKKE